MFPYGESVDTTAKIKELTDGAEVDVAYDGVGMDTLDASLASMMLFGGASGQVPSFDFQRPNSSSGIFLSHALLAWFVRNSEELAKRSAILFNGIGHS